MCAHACSAVTIDMLCKLKGKLEDAQKTLKDTIDLIEKSRTAKDTFCQVSHFNVANCGTLHLSKIVQDHSLVP